jgi:hypothetical protein
MSEIKDDRVRYEGKIGCRPFTVWIGSVEEYKHKKIDLEGWFSFDHDITLEDVIKSVQLADGDNPVFKITGSIPLFIGIRHLYNYYESIGKKYDMFNLLYLFFSEKKTK